MKDKSQTATSEVPLFAVLCRRIPSIRSSLFLVMFVEVPPWGGNEYVRHCLDDL